MLFDLIDDPGESKNIAARKSSVVNALKTKLEAWRASCKDSFAGMDYS